VCSSDLAYAYNLLDAVLCSGNAGGMAEKPAKEETLKLGLGPRGRDGLVLMAEAKW
jgi:hypothetical protein